MVGRNSLFECGEALDQAAQRGYGCSTSGSLQGQVGQSFEQPDLVEGAPGQGRELELDHL